MKTNREYRTLIEFRANDTDEYVVEGYATTFDSKYLLYKEDDYELYEQISPDAFKDCDMTDVIFQYDHEGRVFARTRNKTLEVLPDSKGLFIKANLGGTEQGRQLYSDIKGGYIDRMSFSFIVDEQTYTRTDNDESETVLRTITKISKLYDVSAVSIPANDSTSISARTLFNGVIEEIEAERLQRAKLRLKIKLMGD